MKFLRTRVLTLPTIYTSTGLAKKKNPCEEKQKWKLGMLQLQHSYISWEGWSQQELLFPAWGKFRRWGNWRYRPSPFQQYLGSGHTRLELQINHPTTKSLWLLPKLRVTTNDSSKQQQSSWAFIHPLPHPGKPPFPFGQCWTHFCFTINICICLGTAVPDSKPHGM